MPTDAFDFISLSATFGLIATGLLVVNLLLGVVLSTKFRTTPAWERLRRTTAWRRLPPRVRAVSVYQLHNWTAYAAIAVALVHPLLLLLDAKGRFSLLNIVAPFTGPHQRYVYTLGAVAFYGLLVAVLTSTVVVRRWLSNRVWKWVHLVSYGAASLFLVHGLMADPLLLDRPVNFIDAEKVLSEAGIVLLVAAVVYRVRYRAAKRASEAAYPLRVVRVARETETTRTFTLGVPERFRSQFRYTPGQFVTLVVPSGDGLVKRSYSVTGAPESGAELSVAVKRLGPVSNRLVDTVREGDVLDVLPPQGSFFRDTGRVAPRYLFFAAGSGITPFLSITRSVLASRPGGRITLVYANRDEQSVAFKGELDALEREHPDRFDVVHVLDAPGGAGRRGPLTAETLRSLIDEIGPVAETEYYVCGPVGYIALVERVLLDRGVPPEQVHAERFTFAPAALAADVGSTAEESLDVGDAAAPTSAGAPRLTVHVGGTARTVDCREGETVLDAALRTGLVPPFACQVGVCASCKATVTRGRVQTLRHEALTPLDVDQRCVLTCTAVPVSDEVVVRYG